jgi:hypothetical protein
MHNGRFGDPSGSEAVPTILLPGALLLPMSNTPMPRHAENRLDFPSRKAYPGSRCGNGTSTAPSGPLPNAVSLDAASPCIHSARHPPHFSLALHLTLEPDMTYGCQAP